jgi:CelD/BcsL family acetyltransferase involved in cellulose biosynthesis
MARELGAGEARPVAVAATREASEPPDAALRTERIESWDALAAVAGEWSLLCARSRATPFQGPQWALAWGVAYGRTARPCALAVRDGGGVLRGMFPLARVRRRALAALPVARLEVIGSAWANGEYLAPVVDPLAPRAANAIAEAAAARVGPGGLARAALFDDLPAGAAEVDALFRALDARGLAPSLRPRSRCPVVSLEGGVDGVVARVSSGFRRVLRKAFDRAKAEGLVCRVVFEEASIRRALPELMDLHERGWRARGEKGTFASAGKVAFYEAAFPALAAAGAVRLVRAELGGRVLGAALYLADARCYYLVQCGIDPAARAIAVGHCMARAAIEAACGEGCAALDFLRGEERYKLDWGGRDRETVRLRACAPGLRGRLALRGPEAVAALAARGGRALDRARRLWKRRTA